MSRLIQTRPELSWLASTTCLDGLSWCFYVSMTCVDDLPWWLVFSWCLVMMTAFDALPQCLVSMTSWPVFSWIEWIGMEEFSKCEWLSEWVKKWTLNIQSVLFHLYVSTKIIPLMVLVLILREICTANIWLWQCIKKGYEYDVLCSRQTHFLERMSTKCWFVLSLKNPCPVCVPVEKHYPEFIFGC